jgi:hypothetical protein
MSGFWIFMAALGVVFCAALLLTGVALFSPIIVTFDSATRQVRVRWLSMVEYVAALPGGKGKSRLSIAGSPVRIRPRKRKAVGEGEPPGSQKNRRDQATGGRFFIRCLRDSTIRRVLPRQLAKLARGILRSMVLTRSRANLSLPDPAANGILAGALAQSRWGRRLGIRMNFTGTNSVFCEIRLYPHRVVKAIVFFLSSLPYTALYRNWRASS